MARARDAAGMRVRREVNLTVIFTTLIAGATFLGALYLLDALVLARQGLDVRPMLSLHLAPGQWGQAIGGVLVAIAGAVSAVLAKILRRTNRTEALVGRRDEDRDARYAELVALLAALHARFEGVERAGAEKDRRVAAAVAGMAGMFDTGVLATVTPAASTPEPEQAPEPEPGPVVEGPTTAQVRALVASLPPLPGDEPTPGPAHEPDGVSLTAALTAALTAPPVVRPPAARSVEDWHAILYGPTPPTPAP